MKILKYFLEHWLLTIITLSIFVTLVTGACGIEKFYAIGLITFGGLGCLVILFVWLRQLYWFITKTGDYKPEPPSISLDKKIKNFR